MPKFFMHIHDDGKIIKDQEGQNLPSLEAAQAEAKTAIREMLAEKVRLGQEVDGQRLEIVDGAGQTVATVAFREQLRLRPEAAE